MKPRLEKNKSLFQLFFVPLPGITCPTAKSCVDLQDTEWLSWSTGVHVSSLRKLAPTTVVESQSHGDK